MSQINWTKAPGWADQHGYVGGEAAPIWASREQYCYVDGRQYGRTFSFAGREGWGRDEIKGITMRPVDLQAAADALKAEEVFYSAENVSVNADYTTHTSSPANAECKIIQPQWTGEGLPPAGTDCEWRGFPTISWRKTTVIAYNGDKMWIKTEEDGDYIESIAGDFRAIRTPEQIAAEERAAAIEEMWNIYWQPDVPTAKQALGLLWDAGYRKQEAK